MRIVVNHLTRMQPGFICVAGLDLQTGRHIRPVLFGRLMISLLERYGGPFDIGRVVDLGTPHYEGRPPEVEDYRFEPGRIQAVRDASPKEFWSLLVRAAQPKLQEIFGADLRPHGRTCVVDVGQGQASLGCLRLTRRPRLWVNQNERIRAVLDDGELEATVGVTDLRLYEQDGQTPRQAIVEAVAARIADGVGVFVSAGLTRPWMKPGESVARHWLQVNNLHLEDTPVWKECSL